MEAPNNSEKPQECNLPVENDANTIESSKASPIKVHIMDSHEYEVYGVDAIWNNQYRGPLSDFRGLRKPYNANINDVIKLVARHISEGRYTIINMSASPHSLNVLCACEIMMDELLKGFDNELYGQ